MAQVVRKRDSCFAVLADGVLNGSFEFGGAMLRADQKADDEDDVLFGASLLERAAAPQGQSLKS